MDHSSILNKYPTYRDSLLKSYWLYLEGRRMDDNAEGYWRVHDKLYNLEGFDLNHPGGEEWISMTKVRQPLWFIFDLGLSHLINLCLIVGFISI